MGEKLRPMSTRKKIYKNKRLDKALKSFDLEDDYRFHFSTQLLEQMPGVYILWAGKKVTYVGQSNDMGRRLKNNHHIYGKKEISHFISAIPISDNELRKKVEKALIKILSPPRNKKC